MGRYMKALQNPAIIGVLLSLLLLYNGCFVLASSGGAMGGDFFSSDSYGSWGSSSSSYEMYDSYSTWTTSPNMSNSDPGDDEPSVTCVVLIVLAAFCVVGGFFLFFADEKTSVLKKTSVVNKTSVLKKTSFLKLQVDVQRSIEEVQKLYNITSIEERGKFDEETVVNINNIIRKQSASTQRSNDFHNNEYIVITIIVAAEGVHKLPLINSRANLEGALMKLGTIPSGRLKAAHVLWTPQNENDILTKQEYIEDYPLLTRL